MEKLEVGRIEAVIKLNQHLNYLIFGWMGMAVGFISGYLITRHNLWGLVLFAGAFFLAPLWTAISQDIWTRKIARTGAKLEER